MLKEMQRHLLPIVCGLGKSQLISSIYLEQFELRRVLVDGFKVRQNPESTNYQYSTKAGEDQLVTVSILRGVYCLFFSQSTMSGNSPSDEVYGFPSSKPLSLPDIVSGQGNDVSKGKAESSHITQEDLYELSSLLQIL